MLKYMLLAAYALAAFAPDFLYAGAASPASTCRVERHRPVPGSASSVLG